MPIAEEHLAAWRRDGYAIVPGFLTGDEVDAALENVAAYRPTWDEYVATPHRYPTVASSAFDFFEFPFVGDALNDLTAHPDLIDAVERLLGTDELALATSLMWTKYAGTHDFEQNLHADYRNNTLVHPRDDGIYGQIPFIVYLTDVDIAMGPTYVVSRSHSDHDDVSINFRGRDRYPDLYEHEAPVTVPAGSLLMYSMRTFHRGSAMTADAGHRFTVHIVYRAAACQWMGWRAWARYADEPAMIRFLTRASPRVRTLLGFPAPGHDYWNTETIAGVAARYPGIDMTPYVS